VEIMNYSIIGSCAHRSAMAAVLAENSLLVARVDVVGIQE
jgi:hypothetical protein